MTKQEVLRDAYLQVLDISLTTMIKMAQASGLSYKEGSGLIEEAFILMAQATKKAREEIK